MADEQHPQATFMERAIKLSREAGVEKKTGGCFGAVVVKDGKIIGEGSNHVVAHNDPTWHGEVAAIREAAKNLGQPHLTGCVLYTSAEPCPMCMTACYWARLEHVYYGATVGDARKHGDFEDDDFYAELAKPYSDRKLPCEQFMRAEAVKVWEEFEKMPDRVHY